MSAASVLFLWRLYLYQSSSSIRFGGKMGLMNVWRATRRACDRARVGGPWVAAVAVRRLPRGPVLQSFSSGMRKLPLQLLTA